MVDIGQWFLNNMGKNGWTTAGMEDEMNRYKLRILGDEYESDVFALVAETRESLRVCGYYGIVRLEAKYEYDSPYNFDELEDIKSALVYAEENLLTLGIPFEKKYIFHVKNPANAARKNEKMRRKLGLKELEEKG